MSEIVSEAASEAAIVPLGICRVCDAMAKFPNSDVDACQRCLEKLGLCLTVACCHAKKGEPLNKYTAPFVVVLRSGREIRFTSAYLNYGGDWITPNDVKSVSKASGTEPHDGEKYFHELTFRLSEVAYSYVEDDALPRAAQSLTPWR